MQSNPILTNNAVRPPPIYIIIMIIISMTGPALLNLITDARQPYTLQRACWIGLLFLTGGWLIISLVQTFPLRTNNGTYSHADENQTPYLGFFL